MLLLFVLIGNEGSLENGSVSAKKRDGNGSPYQKGAVVGSMYVAGPMK